MRRCTLHGSTLLAVFKTAAFSVTAVTGGPVPVKFKFPGSSGVVRPPYKRRTIPANMSLSVRLQRMLLRLSHINRGTISLENGIVKQTNFHCSNLYPQCGQSDRVKKRSHRRNPPHSGQRQYFRVPKMTEPKPAICTLLHCKYNRGPVKIKCELLLF